ncbi:hypothetical protein PISMIDRAFT_681388, partial [Pisolithus microcarpus 441]
KQLVNIPSRHGGIKGKKRTEGLAVLSPSNGMFVCKLLGPPTQAGVNVKLRSSSRGQQTDTTRFPAKLPDISDTLAPLAMTAPARAFVRRILGAQRKA